MQLYKPLIGLLLALMLISDSKCFSLSSSLDKAVDKIVNKITDKINRASSGILDPDSNSSIKEKFFQKIKEVVSLDRLRDKFEDKFGELPDKLKSILCDKVKGELRIFKYAAVVTAFSSLIGSLSCAVICFIFIVKRCENRNKFYIDYKTPPNSPVYQQNKEKVNLFNNNAHKNSPNNDNIYQEPYGESS